MREDRDPSHVIAVSDVLEPSTRLGRFVILDRLGQGGMGVVYSAYDPKLDRRVALKLLRPGGKGRNASKARNRLVREARALARLSHPNVVPVHDVGVIDGQVFVVMEFVDGQSLRRWTRSRERSWREILAVYREAGAGLAAAHRLGVIHRDFKPDNAIVGDDMRVRVIDFGLARAFRDHRPDTGDGLSDSVGAISVPAVLAGNALGEALGAAHTSTLWRDAGKNSGVPPVYDDSQPHTTMGSSLTETRAVVGTPGYISPEQLAGARVGPATDQFSFCVSLFEALYGHRPFAGRRMEEIYDNMLAGRVRAPGKQSGVPGWIYAVLCRGLAAEPAQRYPSMQALLTALAPRSSRTRWWLAALIVLLSLVGGYLLLRPTPARVALCAGGGQQIAEVWTWERRQAVKNALLGLNNAYAHEAWARVEAGLGGYATDWAAMHESACMAHQRGEQSDRLLDHRMRCLDQRRAAMDSAVTVLGEIVAESLPRAVEVVHQLPPIEACANLDALLADVPAPASPRVAAQVDSVRQRLLRVEALEHSGRYQEALDEVVAVVASAEELEYRPLLAEALLVHGRVLVASDRRREAVELLDRAASAALATGMDGVAVDALARLIYAHGTRSTKDGVAMILARLAESLAERVPRNTFVRALLLNNIGVVHMAEGQPERARAYFERALAVRNSGSAGQLELFSILENLARVSPDPQRRRELMHTALSELEHELGPSHPMVLAIELSYSRLVESPLRARDLLDDVCARYEHLHPGLNDERARCEGLLGLLHGDLGDIQRAVRHLDNAVELTAGYSHAWWRGARDLARGYARYYQGDLQAAQVAFEGALGIHDKAPDTWWWREREAEVRLGIGLVHLAAGRDARAVAALEAALAIFRDLDRDMGELHRDAELARKEALARLSLARALSGGNRAGTCARALALLEQARDWYVSAGPGLEHRLDDIARLRSDHLSACQ